MSPGLPRHHRAFPLHFEDLDVLFRCPLFFGPSLAGYLFIGNNGRTLTHPVTSIIEARVLVTHPNDGSAPQFLADTIMSGQTYLFRTTISSMVLVFATPIPYP